VLPRSDRGCCAAAGGPARRGAQVRPAGPGASARLLGRRGQAARGRRSINLGATVGAPLDPGAINPTEAVEALTASRVPFLIGVRHHSPVLASAIPRLLDAAAPDLILLELPEELQQWIDWLSAEDLVAPVALAAGRADGNGVV